MRRNLWYCGAILFLLATMCVGAVCGEGGPNADSSSNDVVGKAVIAIHPDTAVHLGPAEDAAKVSPSITGRSFHVESRQGEWLEIANAPNWWIRRSEIVPQSEAIEFFTAALGRSPTAYAYASRGLASLKEKKDIRRALADAEAAIRLDPMSEFGFLCRAVCMETQGRCNEAIEDYSQAIALNPKLWGAFIARGKARILAKVSADHVEVASDFDDVVRDFNTAIELSPNSMTLLPLGSRAMAYFGRAQLNQSEGNLAAAERDFLAAVEDFSRARQEAELLLTQGGADSPFADKRRELVRGFTSKNADSLAKLGELRSAQGKTEAALANFAAAIAIEPDRAELYRIRGEALLRLGDKEGAAEDIDQALKLAPDDVAGHLARAGVFYLQVRYLSAIEECTQVIKADPKHARARYLRGHLRALLRDYDAAFDDLSAAVSLDPKNAAPYKDRARISLKLRQAEKAIDDLNEAIRISPNDREAYQLRAAAWKTLRKNELANKDLAEAKRLETIRK